MSIRRSVETEFVRWSHQAPLHTDMYFKFKQTHFPVTVTDCCTTNGSPVSTSKPISYVSSKQMSSSIWRFFMRGLQFTIHIRLLHAVEDADALLSRVVTRILSLLLFVIPKCFLPHAPSMTQWAIATAGDAIVVSYDRNTKTDLLCYQLCHSIPWNDSGRQKEMTFVLHEDRYRTEIKVVEVSDSILTEHMRRPVELYRITCFNNLKSSWRTTDCLSRNSIQIGFKVPHSFIVLSFIFITNTLRSFKFINVDKEREEDDVCKFSFPK